MKKKIKKVAKAKAKAKVKAKAKPKATMLSIFAKMVTIKKNVKATVKSKPVKSKPAVKAPKSNTGYRQLKDGTYRIHGWKVTNIPTEKFPELVSIEHKSVFKRFINLTMATKFIEQAESERLIQGGGKAVEKELKSVGAGANIGIERPESAPVLEEGQHARTLTVPIEE